MLHRSLGLVATLGGTAFVGGLIAALQGGNESTWLWIVSIVGFAVLVVGGVGWILTHENSPKGSPTRAWPLGVGVTEIGGAEAPAKPQPSAEDKAVQALEQRSYQIGSATISGKELFRQVADRLARHRDAFLFGQDVAHVLGVESRSVPEQEILNDLVVLGLVDSEYHAPPTQSGPQSPIARPESPHQYYLSVLGKSVLAHLLVGDSFLGNVLDVEFERRHDFDSIQGRSRLRAKTLGISITARPRDVERCTMRVMALDFRNPHADNDAEWKQVVAFSPITMAWSFNDGGGGEQPIRKGTAKFCDLVVYEHHQTNEPASRKARLVCLQANQRDLPANEIGFAQYRARCEISAAGDFEPLVALAYFEFDPGQDDDDWQLTFVEPKLAVVDQGSKWARSRPHPTLTPIEDSE